MPSPRSSGVTGFIVDLFGGVTNCCLPAFDTSGLGVSCDVVVRLGVRASSAGPRRRFREAGVVDGVACSRVCTGDPPMIASELAAMLAA